jgi:hypothetical protein
MFRAVFRLEFRRNRMALVSLASLAFAYAGILAFFFPTIRDNAANMQVYLDAYPKEFLSVLGLEGSLADPAIFWTSYIGITLWPIVAAIGGIVGATRATAVDTEGGWIELPLAGRLPRHAYLLAAILVQPLAMALLVASMVGGFLVVGGLVGAGFDWGRFVLAGVGSWLFGCAIAAVTSVLAVATLSRGRAAGIVVGILVLMYLFRVVAGFEKSLAWVGDLSVFRYLYPTRIIHDGGLPPLETAAFVVIAGAAWAGAIVLFRRRDLLA